MECNIDDNNYTYNYYYQFQIKIEYKIPCELCLRF